LIGYPIYVDRVLAPIYERHGNQSGTIDRTQ
jgi:hypothetical protein